MIADCIVYVIRTTFQYKDHGSCHMHVTTIDQLGGHGLANEAYTRQYSNFRE